jgi:hypothetical protein
MTKEAMKLALEALELVTWTNNPPVNAAITALLEALAEQPPQQEPVAYLCENAVGHKYFRWKKPSSTYKPIALYTSPPAQQEYERGFIDGMQEQMKRSVDRAVNAMAQRTWVGLTNEEIDLFINGRGDEDDEDYVEPTGDGFGLTDSDLVQLVRRSEAKLKERNQ